MACQGLLLDRGGVPTLRRYGQMAEAEWPIGTGLMPSAPAPDAADA